MKYLLFVLMLNGCTIATNVGVGILTNTLGDVIGDKINDAMEEEEEKEVDE
tara:strand:- start:8077 stop:8229 length:153 start_codon:yes stop_codon:yes gene_type:complete